MARLTTTLLTLRARQGRMFQATRFVAIGANSTVNTQFKTPANVDVSLVATMLTAAAESLVTFIEAPTVTDGTTAISGFAINRQGTIDPQLSIYSDPTEISGGGEIGAVYLPGGRGQSPGFAAVTDVIRTLKRDTDYIVQATNLTNQSQNFQAIWVWIEV